MRTEIEEHLILSATKCDGIAKATNARTNFDGTATSIVQNAPCVSPAIRAPSPACKWAVHKSGPDKSKDHGREQAATLSSASHNNRECQHAKHALESSKQKFRNSVSRMAP